MGCLYEIPSLKAQRSLWKRRQEDKGGQRWCMTPGEQILPHTTGLKHRRTQRDLQRFKLDEVITDKVNMPYHPVVTLNRKTICNWYLLGKRNQFSPTQSHWVHQLPHKVGPGVTDNAKWTSCSFCAYFLFCFGAFILMLVSIFIIFPVFLGKWHGVGWVGRWKRSERSWGRGNNMIKIHCMKKIKLKDNSMSVYKYKCPTLIWETMFWSMIVKTA